VSRRDDGGLRAEFRAHLPQFDWNSVETGMIAAGVPDSNYCCGGCEGWIEYKKTTGWTVPLRPAQVGWILRRARHGGRVTVALRQLASPGPRRDRRDRLWLLAGGAARELRTLGIGDHVRLPVGTVLGCWDGGPAAWDWAAVSDLLLS
jgi:hypothetical protein